MSASLYRSAFVLITLTSSFAAASAQEVAAPAVPQTIWRFIGIPQGIQKIRDVTTNRRGNRPGLERKDPLKRIADPANLESDNPAIKAAAEVKTAEDMKAQKIKAIKYLATIGCGCYDKEGKITEALLAATDDCTPDVRLAAIEAIEEAASGECCKRCGSTSCCNETVSKRLSEIAYERDDSGCPVEPSAEIRSAAKRTLCKCCPGRGPTGMIEEELELPQPVDGSETDSGQQTEEIKGESSESDEDVKGESAEEDGAEPEANSSDADSSAVLIHEEKNLQLPSLNVPNTVLMIGGMPVRPVTIQPISHRIETTTLVTDVKPSPKQNVMQSELPQSKRHYRAVTATVADVNFRTGDVLLQAARPAEINPRGKATVFHRYLTGERQVASLQVLKVGTNAVLARVEDQETLDLIHVGDRVVLR